MGLVNDTGLTAENPLLVRTVPYEHLPEPGATLDLSHSCQTVDRLRSISKSSGCGRSGRVLSTAYAGENIYGWCLTPAAIMLTGALAPVG